MADNGKRQRLGNVLLVCVILTAAAVITDISGHGIPCLFRKITGFRCPGCGNTHAFTACMHFRWKEAFSYNYFFPAEFLYLGFTAAASGIRYIQTGEQTLVTPPERMNTIFLIFVTVWFILRNILDI